MVGTAVVLAISNDDDNRIPPWLIPLIIYSAALVMVWSPLDAVVSADARRPDVVSLVSRDAWLRIVVGLIAAAFAVWMFAVSDFTDSPLVRTWVAVVRGRARDGVAAGALVAATHSPGQRGAREPGARV